MFGVSFTELMLIGAVSLIVVGPQRLPAMMGTVGKWSNKMRRMLFDVRQQSGIDDILRAEGITGGLNEIRALRNAVRGNVSNLTQALTAGPRPAATNSGSVAAAGSRGAPAISPPLAPTPLAVESDPYANVPYDRSREYPDEGCDAYGAIPDDLWAASHRPLAPIAAEPDPAPIAVAAPALTGAPTADVLAVTGVGVAAAGRVGPAPSSDVEVVSGNDDDHLAPANVELRASGDAPIGANAKVISIAPATEPGDAEALAVLDAESPVAHLAPEPERPKTGSSNHADPPPDPSALTPSSTTDVAAPTAT